MTYKVIHAHIKGLHQTIDSWRPNHNENGWKMSAKDWTDKLAAIEVYPCNMWRPLITSGIYIWGHLLPAVMWHLRSYPRLGLRDTNPRIVLYPRLMTSLCMKQLFKCCDLVADIPLSCSYWNTYVCEPSVLGLSWCFLEQSTEYCKRHSIHNGEGY